MVDAGGGAIEATSFNVLGPVTVTHGGVPIDLGTPKERHLLAVLLVEAGHAVSRDRVIEALWPDRPPAKPAASLRAYVSHLRRALADAGRGADAIATEGDGYRLDVDTSEVDAARFEALVGAASSDQLPVEQRIEQLDAALALVRGDPYSDMAYAEFTQREITRLGELVVVAEEMRAELAVESGDAAAWVPRLSVLVDAHPYRDRLRAAHMRALAVTGRHAEAIRSYADHRARLIDETGLEPGPEIRALEAELLALDDVQASDRRQAMSPEETHHARVAERRLLTVVAVARQPRAHDRNQGPDETSAWAEIVAQHAGVVAPVSSLFGAWFGYPVARERDAERAVLAALDIVATDPGATAASVATGLVQIDPAADGVSMAGEALADAPMLAGRAEPGEVLVDHLTERLTARQIAYTRVEDDQLASRAGPARRHMLAATPFVGRDEELGLLRGRVDLAARGEGQVLIVSGDAGAGKTRLLEAVAEEAAPSALEVVRLACSPFNAQTAFHALAEHLQSELYDEGGRPSGRWQAKLSSGPASVAAARRLLAGWAQNGDEALSVLSADPNERRRSLIGAAVQHLTSSAEDGLVLCIVEDVHWADSSTSEMLLALAETTVDRSLALVVSHRTGSPCPVDGVPNATALRLGTLSRAATVDIVRSAHGGALDPETEAAIVERAEGVPLFAEEIARSLASGEKPAPDAVPATLRESLMARLDRSPAARATAHAAAAVQHDVDAPFVAAVTGAAVDQVTKDLEVLCDVGVMLPRGTASSPRYRFRHVLVRDLAYDSVLGPARAELHARIAQELKANHPDVVLDDPGRLAHHWFEAGDFGAAAGSFLLAARRAARVSSFIEAADHAQRGLDAANAGASSAALDSIAMDLHLLLGSVATQVHGPSSDEAARCFAAVLDDPAAEPDERQRYLALWGRWYMVSTSGDPNTAMDLAEQVHDLAMAIGDDEMRLQAHHAMWSTLVLVGRFAEALEHTQAGRELYLAGTHHHLTFEYGGHDPGVCLSSIGGLTQWLMGDRDAGAAAVADAIELGDRLDHGYSQLEGSFGPLVVSAMAGDAEALVSQADGLRQLVAAGRVPATAEGYIDGHRGVAAMLRGETEQARELLARAAPSWRELWGAYCFPLDGFLAAAMAQTGGAEGALREIAAILDDPRHQATWWDAELHRQRAIALAAADASPRDIAHSLGAARAVARVQNATELERLIRSTEAGLGF